MEPVEVVMLIFLIFRFMVEFVLIREWIRHKNKNIGILALATAFLIVAYLGSVGDASSLFYICESIALGILAYFVQQSFYVGKKSIFRWILVWIIILGIIQIPFALQIDPLPPVEEIPISSLVNKLHGLMFIPYALWFSYSVVHGYNSLRNNPEIAPWIKMRYRFLIIYGISVTMISFCLLFATKHEDLSLNWAFKLLFLANIFLMGSEFIAWVMPAKLKTFYNRGWDSQLSEQDHELTEDQILEAWK